MDYPYILSVVFLAVILLWLRWTGAKVVLALRRQLAVQREDFTTSLAAIQQQDRAAYDALAADRDALRSRKDWLEVALGDSRESENALRVIVAQRDEEIASLKGTVPMSPDICADIPKGSGII